MKKKTSTCWLSATKRRGAREGGTATSWLRAEEVKILCFLPQFFFLFALSLRAFPLFFPRSPPTHAPPPAHARRSIV